MFFSFVDLKLCVLMVESGELLGFFGSLNMGEEYFFFLVLCFGILVEDVVNICVIFCGVEIYLSNGVVGEKFGVIFVVKNYLVKIDSLMFDELNLFVDMVVIYFFVLINFNIMVGWIKC